MLKSTVKTLTLRMMILAFGYSTEEPDSSEMQQTEGKAMLYSLLLQIEFLWKFQQ